MFLLAEILRIHLRHAHSKAAARPETFIHLAFSYNMLFFWIFTFAPIIWDCGKTESMDFLGVFLAVQMFHLLSCSVSDSQTRRKVWREVNKWKMINNFILSVNWSGRQSNATFSMFTGLDVFLPVIHLLLHRSSFLKLNQKPNCWCLAKWWQTSEHSTSSVWIAVV